MVNPAHDEIQILISKNPNVKINSVVVKNMMGEMLIEQKQFSKPIDISALSNGIYDIIIETSGSFYTAKFIKQ